MSSPPEAQMMGSPIWVSYVSLKQSQPEVYRQMRQGSQLSAAALESKCFAAQKAESASDQYSMSPFLSPCCVYFP